MAQPHQEEERPRVDPRAFVLFGGAVSFGTLYVGGLALAAGHINIPEAAIDFTRAGMITCAVAMFIRSGFDRLAKLLEDRPDRVAEIYSAGYVDGVARRPPQSPESVKTLIAVK